jgi:hypothetical protein
MFRAPARGSGLGAFIQVCWDRAPARGSGLGAFIQVCWDSSQASVAHLPHPVIAYSWGAALNLVAYPVISYVAAIAAVAKYDHLNSQNGIRSRNEMAKKAEFFFVTASKKR